MAYGCTILGSANWMKGTRPSVAHRAKTRCEHCNLFLGMDGECDHIIPRRDCEAHGLSEWDTGNLQYLCHSCHSRKTNAERWAGHTKRDPKAKFKRRTKVPGRKLMLAMAGVKL